MGGGGGGSNITLLWLVWTDIKTLIDWSVTMPIITTPYLKKATLAVNKRQKLP